MRTCVGFHWQSSCLKAFLNHLYCYAIKKGFGVASFFNLRYLYFNYHLLPWKIVQFMEDLAVIIAFYHLEFR